jgi:Fe-S oxidoreductase
MQEARRKNLEEYREHVWACGRCNYCQNVHAWQLKSSRFNQICPSFFEKRFAAYSGMGRIHIARALLEGEFDYDESPLLEDIMYRCTLCGACEVHCRPVLGREPAGVIEAIRAELVERGKLLPEHQKYLESTTKYSNPFEVPKKERLRWTEDIEFKVKDLTKAQGEVLLYVGCMYSLEPRVRDTAKVFAQILHAAGVDFGFLGAEEKCCGSEQLRIGERGLFEMVAKENIKTFNSLGIKTLVASCPHCYYALKFCYPEVGELNFEILHFSQYLKRLIDDKKIELQEVPHQIITYSDPCNLGRWGGEYEAPREILSSIKGIELRELERNRDEAWCCGAGGGVLTAFPSLAASSAQERVAEAESSGASILATACPWCEYNLRDGIENRKATMELSDIAEIVFKSMKKKGQ